MLVIMGRWSDRTSAVLSRRRPDGSDPSGRDKYVVETDLSGAVGTGEGVQLCVASGLLEKLAGRSPRLSRNSVKISVLPLGASPGR
jgi:hypothetical protein